MSKPLTQKQENFCLAFIRLGDQSAAYREAYNSEKMKPETVNSKACLLIAQGNIKARVTELQVLASERNAVTVDKLVKSLAEFATFDIAELYDDEGKPKPIHEMPKVARQMISKIKPNGEIEILDKMAAIDKLMKHLGGYEKDNTQKKSDIKIKVGYGDAGN